MKNIKFYHLYECITGDKYYKNFLLPIKKVENNKILVLKITTRDYYESAYLKYTHLKYYYFDYYKVISNDKQLIIHNKLLELYKYHYNKTAVDELINFQKNYLLYKLKYFYD